MLSVQRFFRAVCVTSLLGCFLGCASDETAGRIIMSPDMQLPAPRVDAGVSQRRCGDGTRQTGEQCDDGNVRDGDGCDRNCRTEILCGNGRIDPQEQCDDGNRVAGDGCDAQCRTEIICGNDQLDNDEECDDGEADCVNCRVQAVDVSAGGDFAGAFSAGSFDRFSFRLNADGLVSLSAQGNDGSCPDDLDLSLYRTMNGAEPELLLTDTDGGPGFCPRLENSLLRGTYIVEVRSPLGMEVFYTFTALFAGGCGDGRLNAGEECDDGNVRDGDGCSLNCRQESTCGNGVVEGREECDDSNVENGDGCDRGCSFETFDLVSSKVQQESAVGDGSSDTFRFTADGESVFWARSSSGRGVCMAGLDTVMTLFRLTDEGGREQVAENDDGPGLQLCSELSLTLAPGQYELVVGDLFGGDPIEEYVFEFELYQDVSAGGVFPGAVAFDGDDLYRLDQNLDRRVQLRTESLRGLCGGDTQILLFRQTDVGRELIEMADDTDRSTCSVIDTRLPVGMYDVLVVGFQGIAIDQYDFEVLFDGPCGDGRMNIDEECDDGNRRDGDGCSGNCRFELRCGNGNLDDDEECDDGNTENGDGCDAGCSVEVNEIIVGRQTVNGQIGFGGQDVWRFTSDAPSVLSAFTYDANGGCAEPLDTQMALYRVEAGNRILVDENDDLEADFYCAGLEIEIGRGVHELVITDYQDDDAIDYSMTFNLAQEVSNGGPFNGAFVAAGDDRYQFTLAEASQVRLTTGAEDGCPGDTILEVNRIDDAGQLMVVGSDDNGAMGNCSDLALDLDAGRYEATVSGAQLVVIPAYVLNVRIGDSGQ